MRRFLPIAFLLLVAVALLLTRIGQPLPLPKPPSAFDERARVLAKYAAELDLEPVDSLFSWPDEPDPYNLALRAALFPSPEYRRCQLVVVPSFAPEWTIYLTREDGAAAQVVSRRMSEQLWSAMMKAISDDGKKSSYSVGPEAQRMALTRLKVEVDTSQAIIGIETADLLEAVWGRMLKRVRYTGEPWGGEDGVRYQVSHWAPGEGFRSGQTWSPPQGSRPYALVKLAEQMRGFTLKPSPEAEARLRADASTLLSTWKSVVPSRSESSRNHDGSAAR
jgi:hypothetical protein